jgi:ribosomal protein L3 glutamine methyltransferase
VLSKPEFAQASLPSAAEAADSLRTVRDLLRYCVSRLGQAQAFFGHGMANAYQEAGYLIQWALHLPIDSIEVYLDAQLSRSERLCIAELIHSRCVLRRPAAYLTGEAWLAGVCFKADERALVPRSLIAQALHNGLDDWLAKPPGRVLDLCTGGGSLAVLAALHWPQAKLLACDLSPAALMLARENIALHGLQDRIEVIESNLLEALPATRFDLILCNPPYVNAQSMQSLPLEYQAEPPLALAGGKDGMDLIRRIFAQVPAFLNPKGALLLEIGHEQQYFERAFDRIEFKYVPVSQGDQMLVWLPRISLLHLNKAST